MKIAEQYGQVGQQKLLSWRARETIAELDREMYNRDATGRNIRQFVADWLKIKEPEVSPGHDRFDKKSMAKFLEFLRPFGNEREEFAIFHADGEFPLDSLCH